MDSRTIRPFIGVAPLVSRLAALATKTSRIGMSDELNEIASELFHLDAGLARIKTERHFVDESDLDAFVDRLRYGAEG